MKRITSSRISRSGSKKQNLHAHKRIVRKTKEFLIRTKDLRRFCVLQKSFSSRSQSRFPPFLCLFSGAFRLYDVDNDGFITRDEMYNIVDAIYQMVVSTSLSSYFLTKKLSNCCELFCCSLLDFAEFKCISLACNFLKITYSISCLDVMCLLNLMTITNLLINKLINN